MHYLFIYNLFNSCIIKLNMWKYVCVWCEPHHWICSCHSALLNDGVTYYTTEWLLLWIYFVFIKLKLDYNMIYNILTFYRNNFITIIFIINVIHQILTTCYDSLLTLFFNIIWYMLISHTFELKVITNGIIRNV